MTYLSSTSTGNDAVASRTPATAACGNTQVAQIGCDVSGQLCGCGHCHGYVGERTRQHRVTARCLYSRCIPRLCMQRVYGSLQSPTHLQHTHAAPCGRTALCAHGRFRAVLDSAT